MTDYEVIIHTTRGYRFIVTAENAEEAEASAVRGYVEEGDDGEILYESTQEIETKAVPA